MSLDFALFHPLRDFPLNIEGAFPRETTGVWGPSGAGKTTFFHILAGLITPLQGRIVLEGRTLLDTSKGICLPPRKRRMGLVFQDKLLFPHMRIKENLTFGVPYSLRSRVSLKQVVDWLELGPLLSAWPREISGGEAQRVAIGRALLTSPDMLLLDEPFSAVDPGLKASLLMYISRLQEELDIPLLVISHDLTEVTTLARRVFPLQQGKSPGLKEVTQLFPHRQGLFMQAN